MKSKSILMALFAIVPIFVSAQVSWIVKGGPSINSSHQFFFGDNGKAGGRAGIGMEYHLGRIVSIQPSLMLNFKGSNRQSEQTVTTCNGDACRSTFKRTTTKCRQTYLEIPVDVLFRVRIHDQKNALVFNVGPYFAYGIGGKTKTNRMMIESTANKYESGYTTTSDPINTYEQRITESEQNTFDKNGADIRRFDFGLGEGIRFELKKHLTFGFFAECGLVNIMKGEETKHDERIDSKYWDNIEPNHFYDWLFGKHNISIGLEVGYRF